MEYFEMMFIFLFAAALLRPVFIAKPEKRFYDEPNTKDTEK